jgi:hypothetical protein
MLTLGQQACQQGDIRFAGSISLYPASGGSAFRDIDNGCLPGQVSGNDILMTRDESELVTFGPYAPWQGATQPARGECALALTQRGASSIPVKPNMTFCLETSDHRVAVGRLANLTPSEADFQVIVWEPKLGS